MVAGSYRIFRNRQDRCVLAVALDDGLDHGDDWEVGEKGFAGRGPVAVEPCDLEEDGGAAGLDASVVGVGALEAVEARGGVESRLHWVMDSAPVRLRTDNGPANMAVVKHAAPDLIQAAPDTASLETRRKTAAWNEEYLFEAIARKQQ